MSHSVALSVESIQDTYIGACYSLHLLQLCINPQMNPLPHSCTMYRLNITDVLHLGWTVDCWIVDSKKHTDKP